MLDYTGCAKETRRLKREAEEEGYERSAYNYFESRYIYENMRPSNIDIWKWCVIWGKWEMMPHRDTWQEVSQDAKALAMAIGKPVEIMHDTYYQAKPYEWYEYKERDREQSKFIKQLVIEDKYPDLVAIAKKAKHPDGDRIRRYYISHIGPEHAQWYIEADGGSVNVLPNLTNLKKIS